MKSPILLKHINNTDVAIEIRKSFYVKERRIYKVRVVWWNIGECHAPFSMGIEQKLVIPKDSMCDWRLYEYAELD